MADPRILIPTCDPYLPALRPLAYLLNKYWRPNPEVVVGGFSHPDFELPPNFHFLSLGNMSDYPINKWSDQLIAFFAQVPDEVFAFMLDDMWPVRPVDTDAIGILYRYMLQFRNIARADLTSDRFYSGGVKLDYAHAGRLDLCLSARGDYFSSMMPGLWRKEHFMRLLQPNWSPWEIELAGTPKLAKMEDVDVIGTRQMPYKCTLAFRGGSSKKLAGEIPYPFNPVDMEEMRKLGLLEQWEKT